jgi:hypothetical protein
VVWYTWVPKVVEQQLASKTTRTSGGVLDDDSDIGEAVSDCVTGCQ